MEKNFQIKIKDSYHLPIALVEIIDPSETPKPSSAVQIVREFLRSEFKRINSDFLRFECLGPSPFHFDCYMVPGEFSDDDNVHYQSFEMLVDELIKHNKLFSMMSYPMRSHSLSER